LLCASAGRKKTSCKRPGARSNLSIANRAKLAFSEKAKLFLCVHFNGDQRPAIRGAETYYRAKANGNLNLEDDIAFATAVHNALFAGFKSVDPTALDVDNIDVVADRGYFKIEDIEACEKAGLTPYVPKPQRGSPVRKGFFRKDEFRYDPDQDVYICPAGETLSPCDGVNERSLVMVDISAIGVVANSLNAAVNIAKAMVDVRDATAFQGKVFELQRAIIDAQQSIFAANEERSALIKKIGHLEKELANLKAWETEKQRYELQDVWHGSLAYVIKESMRGLEPPHKICANCYQRGHKRILQPRVTGFGRELFCSECKTAIISGSVDLTTALEQARQKPPRP
jgi:hypothetical protein